MNAERILTSKIAGMTTEQLVEASTELNLRTDQDAILVSTYVDNELEKRLDENAFCAHMEELEAALDAA